MRLGAYPCMLRDDTLAKRLYGKEMVMERHRHRYEVNNDFVKALEGSDWTPSGWFEEGNLVEMGELKNHPFMIGTQSHPEFLSRPHRPHPLFYGFIDASSKVTTHAPRHGAVSIHSGQ